MSNAIRFTPLHGANNEGALCSILQIDDFTIMLDCGWDDRFDVKDPHIQQLVQYVDKVDIILLSHSDLAHVGAIPYFSSKLGCKAPIFATFPVTKMAEMNLYDVFLNIENTADASSIIGFNLDDVDAAFEKVVELKFSQRKTFPQGITIVPFGAGRTLGGSIWKISKDTDDFIYAVDFNHRKERILDGTLLGASSISSNPDEDGNVFSTANPITPGKPAVLITDSYNALSKTNPKDQDAFIEKSIIETLRMDGNVLIPMDSATRVLELLVMLDKLWSRQPGLSVYGLCFLSTMGQKTLEFASRQSEWMSDAIKRSFYDNNDLPLRFKHLKIRKRLEELDSMPKPMVVITPSLTLETGFAREIFCRWAQVPNNLILLLDRSVPNSLARYLILEYVMKPRQNYSAPLHIKLRRKVRLEGLELMEYEKKKQEEREAERKRKREEERRKNLIEIRDEEEASDSEDEDDKQMTEVEQDKHNRLFLPENIRYHSQFLMYPCIEKTVQFDEYGMITNLDELRQKVVQEETIEVANPVSKIDKMVDEIEDLEIPRKAVVEEFYVHVVCNVMFADFEGRSNGKSINNILSQVSPRNLILFHGTEEATKSLADYCVQRKITSSVFCPKLMETIEVKLDTTLYRVLLSENLLSNLPFVKYGMFDIAFVDAQTKVEDAPTEEASSSTQNKVLPTFTSSNDQSHHSLYIGDVKLSQFRDILSRNGFQTEFKMGALIANRSIVFKKDITSGKLVMEGTFSPDYFKARQLLYGQFQLV